MKNSKTNSVIPIIKSILNLAWYGGFILVGILLIISIFYSIGDFNIDGKTKITIKDLPSSFSGNGGNNNLLKSLDPAFTDAMINQDINSLTFNTSDIYFKLFLTFSLLISITIVYLILYHLRKIFSGLPINSPFTYQNYKSIRSIAFLIINFVLVEWILKLSMSFILETKYDLKTKLNIELTSAITYILLGLIIFAIAEIFNQGIKLKEEQDLTI